MLEIRLVAIQVGGNAKLNTAKPERLVVARFLEPYARGKKRYYSVPLPLASYSVRAYRFYYS